MFLGRIWRAASESRLNDMTARSDILDLLSDHPDGLTLKQISNLLEMKQCTASPALCYLSKNGEVVVIGEKPKVYRRAYRPFGPCLLQEHWRGVA